MGMRHPCFFLSSFTWAILVPLLLPLFHHWCHPGASASSLPSLAPSNYFCFFFSFITGITQVPPLFLFLPHLRHPTISAFSFLPSLVPPKLAKSLLEQNQRVYHPYVFLYALFLCLFLVNLWLQACLSLFMYIVLSLYLIKDDFIAFYVSCLFCNNYLVNECIYLFFIIFLNCT